MDEKTLGEMISDHKKTLNESKKAYSPIHTKAQKFKTEEDPISFVKVEIGYKSGSVLHEVRDEEYSIDALSYTLDKKTQKVKDEEGAFLGFEPTGEYILTIKVKYTRPQ